MEPDASISPGAICSIGSGLKSNIWVCNNSFYGIKGTSGNAKADVVYTSSGIITNVYTFNNVWESSFWSIPLSSWPVTAFATNGFYNMTGDNKPTDTTGQINGSSTTFVNPATYDFRLKSGGYAVNSGMNLNNYFTTDIAGNTRTLPFDVGAYKYQSNSLTNTINIISSRFNLLIN